MTMMIVIIIIITYDLFWAALMQSLVADWAQNTNQPTN